MKLTGIFGTGSGKLGSSVFATVSGVQIVRPYQPVVANPSTQSQVNQRARLKLASQLASQIAPSIAIPRNGLKSGRNQFVKKNFDLITAENGTAQVDVAGVQLTNGSQALPAVTATADGSSVSFSLAEAVDAAVTRVVYSVYKRTSSGQLQLIGSPVVEEPGNNRKFAGTADANGEDIVVYAYGMKDTSAAATAKYANLNIETGTDVAKLIANRTISASDSVLTATSGVLAAYSNNNPPTGGQG